MSNRHEQRPVPKENLLDDATIEIIKPELIRLTIAGRMQELHPGEAMQPLRVDILLPRSLNTQTTPEVIVSLHGQGANAEFDADVTEALRKHGRIVIAPTTSRRQEYDAASGEDFQDWMKKNFVEKTYADEVADFRRGIELARAWLRKQFGARPDVRLTLLGQSLGASMAADLAPEYHPDNVVLVAPAYSSLEPTDEPLLGATTPRGETLPANLRNTTTSVIRGENDPFITEADARAFIEHGGNLTTIAEAGHTFGKIPFLPGDEKDKRQELITAIIKAI